MNLVVTPSQRLLAAVHFLKNNRDAPRVIQEHIAAKAAPSGK